MSAFRPCLAALIFLLGLAAPPATALEIEVLGTLGSPGEDHTAPTDPPTPGGNGTAGGAAAATAIDSMASSRARAVGGNGGTGGHGSSPVSGDLADAGIGGDGGNGGTAEAETRNESQGPSRASAIAIGGVGGGAGFGGSIPSALPPGEIAGQGGRGGNGGSAQATGFASNQAGPAGSEPAPGVVESVVSAVGGDGGWGWELLLIGYVYGVGGDGGDGGDAQASSEAVSSGNGNAVRVGVGPQDSRGPVVIPPFPPFPGAAAPIGAYGGDGGSSGSIYLVGGGTVPAAPVDGGRGGSALSQSIGTALGDSQVEVLDLARGGSGGDGIAIGGDGGAAHSSAGGSNAGASAVRVEARAHGGDGGGASGVGHQGGDGGAATLGVVHGSSSGGGSVTVLGEVHGGHAGHARGGASTGLAADAWVEDAVEGQTSGALSLFQRAFAGRVRSGEGSDGDATSILRRATNAASLSVVSEARIRDAEPGPIVPPVAGAEVTGGDAWAIGEATNLGGAATAHVLARASQGRGTDRRGGDAHAEALAVSTGDDKAVVVGQSIGSYPFPPLDDPFVRDLFPAPTTGALAGNGSVIPSPLPGASTPGGSGGDAWSRSVGLAQGDSEVTVFDLAMAGVGGMLSSSGGCAHSTAEGRNRGGSAVRVESRAIGGWGFLGGDATAAAIAEGSGAVDAIAAAFAGYGRDEGTGGAALAHARGTGSSGMAQAHAETGSIEIGMFMASAWAPVVSDVWVQATAGAPAPVGVAAGAMPAVLASVVVPGEEVGLPEGFRRVLADAGLSMLHEQEGTESIVLGATYSFSPYDLSVNELVPFAMSFLGLEIDAPGFESLVIRVERPGIDLEYAFSRADQAIDFLLGRTLDLGPPGRPFGVINPPPDWEPFYFPSLVQVEIELTTRSLGDSLRADLVFGVPEPSLAGLALLALVALLRLRVRGALP